MPAIVEKCSNKNLRLLRAIQAQTKLKRCPAAPIKMKLAVSTNKSLNRIVSRKLPK